MHQSALTYAQVIRLPNVLASARRDDAGAPRRPDVHVGIVFHALAAFSSPSLAGWISFAATAPARGQPAGRSVPRPGGRVARIVIDLAVSAALMLALAVAVLLHQATRWCCLFSLRLCAHSR